MEKEGRGESPNIDFTGNLRTGLFLAQDDGGQTR